MLSTAPHGTLLHTNIPCICKFSMLLYKMDVLVCIYCDCITIWPYMNSGGIPWSDLTWSARLILKTLTLSVPWSRLIISQPLSPGNWWKKVRLSATFEESEHVNSQIKSKSTHFTSYYWSHYWPLLIHILWYSPLSSIFNIRYLVFRWEFLGK